MTSNKKPFPWVKIAIVAFPTWIIISGVIGLWLYFHQQDKRSDMRDKVYQQAINSKSIADDFHKITNIIGERNFYSESGRAGLTRIVSMIDGAVGKSNMGYDVIKTPTNIGDYPLIEIQSKKKSNANRIGIIVGYDASPILKKGTENASTLAITMAAAQSLVGAELDKNVSFIFAPHTLGNEPEIIQISQFIYQKFINQENLEQLIYIPSLLHSNKIEAIIPHSEMPLLKKSYDIIKVASAEQNCLIDQKNLGKMLFDLGLPVATLFTPNNDELSEELIESIDPPEINLSTNANALVKLIRRLATNSN
jgi:hypothetical protein